MGAWGFGPFDNDTAADFAGTLDEAPGPARVEMLHDALIVVKDCGSQVNGAQAEVGLAAAALVARGLSGGDEFQSPHYGPANPIPAIPQDFIPVAFDVVSRVLDEDNDIRADWRENPDGDKWLTTMRRLRAVLASGFPGTEDTLW